MLDLKRQYEPLQKELLGALGHVLQTQQFMVLTDQILIERQRKDDHTALVDKIDKKSLLPDV